MFDIGFWEIILIGVVALLVVGPDKFPGMIRDTARWAARLRRFIVDTKRDIEREIRFEDIEKDLTARKALENKSKLAPETNPQPSQSDTTTIDKQSPA
jgi:sec-independent protein translocase protein TatB